MTVAAADGAYQGWLFFAYQDSNASVVFHYHAVLAGAALKVLSDATSATFTYGHSSPGPGQAGSAAIGPGMTYEAVVGATTLTLVGCGSYLYWVNPSHGPPESCTFSYNGTVNY